MPLVYRHEKNAPLSIQELDGNFQDLDERLKYLEEKMDQQGVLQEIKVENNRIFFVNDQGKILADIPIPSIQFNPKGAWASQTFYKKFDVVVIPGQSFLCIENHHSSSTLQTDIAAKKWQLLIDVLTLLKGK